MIYVMPCPEECEKSFPVHGCGRIINAPEPDGSCWRCDGVGFVEHDGNSTDFRTRT